MSSRAQRSKLHDRGGCFVAPLLTRKSWPTGRKIRRNSGSFMHGGRPTGRWELAMTWTRGGSTRTYHALVRAGTWLTPAYPQWRGGTATGPDPRRARSSEHVRPDVGDDATDPHHYRL